MSESTAPDEEVRDQQEDQPAPDLEAQADQAEPETNDEPDWFSETFDPATLPDELRPAYKQMQGAFTQKTQTLAEERKEIEQHQQLLSLLQSDDPEEQKLALHALGYDIDPFDDEADDDLAEYDVEDNDLDALRAELAEIREWRDSQQDQTEQAEFEEAFGAFIDEELDKLEQSTGRKFDDDELELLAAVADKLHDEDNLPDFGKAYERLYGDFLPKQRKQWLDGKKPTPAPGKGTSGTPQVDLSDDNARIRLMAEAIEAGGD